MSVGIQQYSNIHEIVTLTDKVNMKLGIFFRVF